MRQFWTCQKRKELGVTQRSLRPLALSPSITDAPIPKSASLGWRRKSVWVFLQQLVFFPFYSWWRRVSDFPEPLGPLDGAWVI